MPGLVSVLRLLSTVHVLVTLVSTIDIDFYLQRCFLLVNLPLTCYAVATLLAWPASLRTIRAVRVIRLLGRMSRLRTVMWRKTRGVKLQFVAFSAGLGFGVCFQAGAA